MPDLIIIAGPNGAGKTTFAREYLSAECAGVAFVNADEIERAQPSPLVGRRIAQRLAIFANSRYPPLMATRNINLTDALDRFVAEKVESGSYQNASEVIRAGLRLLKDEEETRAKKIAALDAAIQVGLDDVAAGRVIEVDDIDAFMKEIEDEVLAEADETAPAK